MVLLNSNLIHLVGSDGHNTRRRPIKLSDARNLVAEGWGEARACAIFEDNAKFILAGEPFTSPEPMPIQPLKRGIWGTLKKVFSA